MIAQADGPGGEPPGPEAGQNAAYRLTLQSPGTLFNTAFPQLIYVILRFKSWF